MEEDLDPEVIKATQISLGKYVKRPPLNEKLLKKPPFRFLHDIITTVLKTTGFFEGLFDENELISDNVKDRDGKISFLHKVISIISITTGKTLLVKPSKIVAGQEPKRTNELLQCLAWALENNLSSQEAVIKYRGDKNIQKEDKLETHSKDLNKLNRKGHDSKKSSSKVQNSKSQNRKSTELFIPKKGKEKSNDKKKESAEVKNESTNKNAQPKLISKKGTNNTKLASQSNTKLNESKNLTPTGGSKDEIQKIEIKTDEHSNDGNCVTDTVDLKNNEEIGYTNVNTAESENALSTPIIDLKSNVIANITDKDNKELNHMKSYEFNNETLKKDNQFINENIERKNNQELEKNLQKIQINFLEANSVITNDSGNFTKLPPEPENNTNTKLITPINNDTNNARTASVRPSSSRPGAPRPKEKLENLITETESHLLGKVHIIAEHDQNEEEDDSNIIIVDKSEGLSIMSKEHAQKIDFSSNEHGHLVQQILDSQKEFSQVGGKTEIEWQLGTQKTVVAQQQEVELLRYNIQALTRVTNPLGKLLDHIQEDVEVMRQELQQWTSINDEISKEIHQENTLSEDSQLPLHSKLKHLETDIQEKSDKINDLKVLIHKNSSRIEKLLSNGNLQ